jgi:3-hydroxyisobutyrate dehydrogenase-like beta-hydroxyacid dehydrogenase
VYGENGLAARLSLGQPLVDTSTVGPDEVRSVAARLPPGVAFVNPPVRGSVPEATAGRLATPGAAASVKISVAAAPSVPQSR